MARTYIPTELELPKGFRVKVDTATNTFPTGECNGDEYEIDYVNENPFSPDGKVVLFRVAVCPDETKALDTFNSGFYTIWPWHFLYSISDGRTGFEWIFQPAKYDFKLNNVDNKLLIEGITQEKDTQKMLGATTTAVARSKNVVVVVIVYVQGMNKATNQAIYYLSLVIEKLQQGQR